MKPTAAIAISGGIDSLVAAHLLNQAGHPIVGLHFITGFEAWIPPSGKTASTTALVAMAKARLNPVEDQLQARIEVVDMREAFQHQVVDYFTRAYAAGLTPNPCLVCNPAIKFGQLLAHARGLGAAFLATGHYARIVRAPNESPKLLRGVDETKDQSYFLARLTPEQLALARFPLGAHTKTDTRRMAADAGLQPLAEKESQDICFIHEGAYSDFLSSQPGFCTTPGPVVDTKGNRLGTHRGLHRRTVGQRRGLGIPGPEPYYVVRLDSQANRLVVGTKEALYRKWCRVEKINWIVPPPTEQLDIAVRIRYRHRAVAARLMTTKDGAKVVFSAPQAAITPGQGAVFYDADRVLGGGWICKDAETGETLDDAV
jgi:tRNA-specific 2-thiouridylase